MSESRVNDKSSESLLTRRDFVARASRAGIALTILPRDLHGLIRPLVEAHPTAEALGHGILTAPVSPALFSGLRWRMIGPFRGGRVAAATGVPGRPNDFYFGAVEVVIDPSNSQVVYAGLWNTRRPPWFTYAPTNGPGGGIFKSTDGGSTWSRLSNGLPREGIGRTGVAISPTNPNRVYAIVDCLLPEAPPQPEPPLGAPVPTPAPAGARPSSPPPGQGGFFRSDDAGATWTRLSNDPALWARGWYFEKITVDPSDPDTVYVPNVAVNRTMDGGKTWVVLRGSPGGDDYHQAWVSAGDPNTMIVASDQGAVITRNARSKDPREVTWTSWLNQPTAQIYHLSVDYRFPYWVTGAQQDSGAIAVRSRGKFAQISMRDWEPIAPGGESGYTAGDRLNPGVVYGGDGQRWNLDANIPVEGTSRPKSPEPARGDWTQPLVFSRADPHSLYYANQFVFKTTDEAKTWIQISPDLTRAQIFVPPTLDATASAAVDRNGQRGVVYTIAPSPLRGPMIWIGTDDGLIQLTLDDGKSWQNVTPGVITPWSRVTMIEASHFDPSSAYASVDRHQLQDFDPYIYRTRDMGKTWQQITRGLPADVYVHVVKEDPLRRGMLVAGTERGLHISFDDGDNWQPLQLNMPVTSMRDLEFYGNDVIVATHGRGFWVIEDISRLRQLSDLVTREDAYLFKPADAINFIEGTDNGTPLQKDEPEAENPPNGAVIDYYLKRNAVGTVTMAILDASGAAIRTFSRDPNAQRPPTGRGRGGAAPTGLARGSPLLQAEPEPLARTAGMHRVVWNPLRERPRGAPPVDEGGPQDTLYIGTFTAKLTINGKSYTQPFTVKPDPRARALPA